MTAAPTPRELLAEKVAAGMRTRLSVNVLRHAPQVGHGWLNELSVALAADALAVVREALREPTEEMLDRAVSFALNVKIGGEYGWTQYMRDLWQHQMSASPLGGEP